MAFQNDGRATGVRIIVVRPSLPEIQASLLITQRVVAHLVLLRAGMRIPQAAISSAIQKPASVWAWMVTMTCGPAGRYLCCSKRFSLSERISTSMWTPSLTADLRKMLRNLMKWSPATPSTVTFAMRRHSPSSTLGVDTSAGALPAVSWRAGGIGIVLRRRLRPNIFMWALNNAVIKSTVCCIYFLLEAAVVFRDTTRLFRQ